MMTSKSKKRVDIPKLVGKLWGVLEVPGAMVLRAQCLEEVEDHSALWIIASMMRCPEANTLVVRKGIQNVTGWLL